MQHSSIAPQVLLLLYCSTTWYRQCYNSIIIVSIVLIVLYVMDMIEQKTIRHDIFPNISMPSYIFLHAISTRQWLVFRRHFYAIVDVSRHFYAIVDVSLHFFYPTASILIFRYKKIVRTYTFRYFDSVRSLIFRCALSMQQSVFRCDIQHFDLIFDVRYSQCLTLVENKQKNGDTKRQNTRKKLDSMY